jgi:glycosyltransferase involved in cell wall biosynthesis
LPSHQWHEGARGPEAGAGAPLSLAYIGRIAREAGIREVVYGLRLARERGVLPRLVIAGSGEDEACLSSIAERLDLTENVDFVGPVFAEARLRLLQCVDLSVLPRCGTGLLQTLHYSLLAGVPVIAARTGSASDAIVGKVHGLLLPSSEPEEYGEAMCRLAFDRALLAQMRAACRGRQGVRTAA